MCFEGIMERCGKSIRKTVQTEPQLMKTPRAMHVIDASIITAGMTIIEYCKHNYLHYFNRWLLLGNTVVEKFAIFRWWDCMSLWALIVTDIAFPLFCGTPITGNRHVPKTFHNMPSVWCMPHSLVLLVILVTEYIHAGTHFFFCWS